MNTLDEDWINPDLMANTKISNLRRIIPPLKCALKDDNLKIAVKLLKAAKSEQVINLRVSIGPDIRKVVKYRTRRTASEKMVHTVTFDHRKFQMVCNRFRGTIKFIED
jgi:hypothetical protein